MLKLFARVILVVVLVGVAVPAVSLILPVGASVAFADDPKPCTGC